MGVKITIQGERAKKGERMTSGARWMLVAVKGRKRVFRAKLIDTVNKGKTRLAIFNVPK